MARLDLIATYIVTSRRNGTLYLGVTSDLVHRGLQHRTGAFTVFSSAYGCTILVWWEHYGDLASAIAREKQLKKWRRAWKIALIEERNPQWRDLYEDFLQPPPPTFLDP
jgi:putative endonuclease